MNLKEYLEKSIKPDLKKMQSSEIEAERMKYWKCPKCHEMTVIEEKMCWKCYADKPENIEHPSKDEIIKTLKKSVSSAPFYAGMVIFALAVFVMFGGVHLGIEKNDLIISGLVAVPGVLLILYSIYRKIKGR